MPGCDDSRQVTVMVLMKSEFKSKVRSVRTAFRDSMFNIHFFTNVDRKRKSDMHIDALKKAREISKNSYVILITDCMITISSPEVIANTVRNMMRYDADFIYLNRYNDRCELSRKAKCKDGSLRLPNNTNGKCDSDLSDNTNDITVIKTHSPHGDDCLMLSPKGRDIILKLKPMCNGKKLCINGNLSEALHEAVDKNWVSAIAASPNLFEFDIVDNATDNENFLRRCECAPLQLLAEPAETTSGTGNLLILIFVLFIVLAVAWALINVGPK